MRVSTTPFNRVTPKGVIDLTEHRRDEDLSRANEVCRLTNTYTDSSIPDRQTASIRTAISRRRLGDSELAVPTEAIIHSGVVVDVLKGETKS